MFQTLRMLVRYTCDLIPLSWHLPRGSWCYSWDFG